MRGKNYVFFYIGSTTKFIFKQTNALALSNLYRAE